MGFFETVSGINDLDAEFLRTDAEYRRLSKKVERTSEARRALPAGSSRKRVTTANAKWSIACEAKERRFKQLAAKKEGA